MRVIERTRQGQIALEQVMITGFGLTALVIIAYFVYSQNQEASDKIAEAQLFKIGNDIVKNSETVYFLGYPTREAFEETMPAGVKSIEIRRNWAAGSNELIFRMASGKESVYTTSIPILGFFGEDNQGYKKVVMHALQNLSGSPYVLVTFTGNCQTQTSYDSDQDGTVNDLDLGFCNSCIGSIDESCKTCDFNGDCRIDNNDLSMWVVLVKNNHPSATISGLSTAAAGSPASFTASASDVDNNLNKVSVYQSPASAENPSLIGECTTPPLTPCSVSWTPASAGEYYIFANATDTAGTICSGNPFRLTMGTARCDYAQDSLTLHVT
ncbi:hypothetical protein HYY72_00785 [Candidatus Woesearchaeota archaeon]|nr:hypothetical protein [Candidatus Woesearchaeota archaeon]